MRQWMNELESLQQDSFNDDRNNYRRLVPLYHGNLHYGDPAGWMTVAEQQSTIAAEFENIMNNYTNNIRPMEWILTAGENSEADENERIMDRCGVLERHIQRTMYYIHLTNMGYNPTGQLPHLPMHE